MALTSNRGVSGSFTGTTSSAATDVCSNFAVDISGGAGTVNVERLAPDGSTWITLEAITVDSDEHAKEYEGVGASVRLTCSAYTSEIDYWVQGYNKPL